MDPIPDSVMRIEAMNAAVATAPEMESHDDFMARVRMIYAFLSHTEAARRHEHEGIQTH